MNWKAGVNSAGCWVTSRRPPEGGSRPLSWVRANGKKKWKVTFTGHLISLFCHGLGLWWKREGEGDRGGEMPPRSERKQFSSASKNFPFFFFHAFVREGFFFFFCKLAVILGFNVCVLRRVLGPDWTMRAGVFLFFFLPFRLYLTFMKRFRLWRHWE